MTSATLRTAIAEDAPVLTEVALRSKAHWGYSQEFMDACREELTITAEDVAADRFVVAEQDGRVVGFYGLTVSTPVGRLQYLYVDPDSMSRGHGKALLQDARSHGRSHGMTHMTIDADPHAEAFYVSHGAVRVDLTPSGSIPGRMLPQLELST